MRFLGAAGIAPKSSTVRVTTQDNRAWGFPPELEGSILPYQTVFTSSVITDVPLFIITHTFN